MARMRARITKVLEDGTEVELVNVDDHPFVVKAVLKDVIRRIRDTAPPVEPIPGQMKFRVKWGRAA